MKSKWGFLAGLGVGLALGVILAPQSGKETQDFIAQKTREGLDQASAATKHLRTQAGNLADKAKGHATEVAESAREAFREKVSNL
ncbi:MAG: YtxH domain-containing protein [Candidatus Dormibacteraceae bacterium]